MLSRRQFIRIVAIGSSAGIAAGCGVVDLTEGLRLLSRSRVLMGTIVTFNVFSNDPSRAEAAISACLEGMEELEKVLSRFVPDSSLSKLNRAGRLSNPPESLGEVIQEGYRISELSNGSFDISILPLLKLYLDHRLPTGVPTADVVSQKLRLVDYRQIQIGEGEIRFGRKGMEATLDGIAKGYIVDHGVQALIEFGFDDVMVEAGGDLYASGNKSSDGLWRIGLRPPRIEQPALMAKFHLHDKAVATSGDYEQAFSSNYVHHHILDPRTGYSSPHLASATLIAENCTLADGWATALMVMDPAEGMRLIESLSGIEAMLVAKNLETRFSSGFPRIE